MEKFHLKINNNNNTYRQHFADKTSITFFLLNFLILFVRHTLNDFERFLVRFLYFLFYFSLTSICIDCRHSKAKRNYHFNLYSTLH